MKEGWEAVIGMEIHAQLATETKIFCACAANFGDEPNANTCPVCLGLPGALPVLNEKVVELGAKAALSLGLNVNETSIFARKNYFYPDLPKGYQISQFDEPICGEGFLDILVEGKGAKRIGIQRIHMEEDAGKSMHLASTTLVNLNRAGVLCRYRGEKVSVKLCVANRSKPMLLQLLFPTPQRPRRPVCPI